MNNILQKIKIRSIIAAILLLGQQLLRCRHRKDYEDYQRENAVVQKTLQSLIHGSKAGWSAAAAVLKPNR